MIAAALVLLLASAAIFAAVAWFRRASRDLDRHIDEALAVARERDLDAGIAAFNALGRSANR